MLWLVLHDDILCNIHHIIRSMVSFSQHETQVGIEVLDLISSSTERKSNTTSHLLQIQKLMNGNILLN